MSVDAAAVDRLPWLADEPAPQPLWPRYGGLLPWAAAAIAIIVAGAWLGARIAQQAAVRTAGQARSSTTVKLPPPHPPAVAERHSPAQPKVDAAPVREVPRPTREAPVAAASARRSAPHRLGPASKPREARHVAAVRRHAVAPRRRNSHVASGASGRRVEIGAFGSADQAHRGWGVITRKYPGMTDLPAVVRQARNSKGRTFYRFDVGTTSQAHSEVLCQRMAKIGLSCAVVGLPAKTKAKR